MNYQLQIVVAKLLKTESNKKLLDLFSLFLNVFYPINRQ